MRGHQPAPKSTANDWHKADIKAALEKRGWSIRSLAASLNLNSATVNNALRSRYPASEKRIATAIGVHPMTIWPSRYNSDGTPNGRRGNPNWIAGRSAQGKRSTGAAAVNGKNARAR